MYALLAAILALGGAPRSSQRLQPQASRLAAPELSIIIAAVGSETLTLPATAEPELDLGTVSASRNSPSRRSYRGASVLRRTLQVRVEGSNPKTQFARVRAFLTGDDRRCRVRIDGIPVSLAPQLIDATAPLGKSVLHTIEIEISPSSPEGPLAWAITWVAETED